jgi:hypothetical protein
VEVAPAPEPSDHEQPSDTSELQAVAHLPIIGTRHGAGKEPLAGGAGQSVPPEEADRPRRFEDSFCQASGELQRLRLSALGIFSVVTAGVAGSSLAVSGGRPECGP